MGPSMASDPAGSAAEGFMMRAPIVAKNKLQRLHVRLLPIMRLDPYVALLDTVDQLMRIEFAEIGGDFE